ncbi:MAG: hypothetical protein AB8B61_02705, partial [Cyclobacteriaceae bacterium]
ATHVKGYLSNLDENYTIKQLNVSPFVLYGIGGLHYLYSKVTVDDPSLSAPLVGLLNGVEEESEFFGATLGVGEDIEISSKIIPYAEIKYYIVDDASFAGLVAGIKFTITD